MENEKLRNTLKTMFHLQTQIHLTIESLNEIERNQKILENIKLDNFFDKSFNLKRSAGAILANYSIILFCSFLDEYHNFFNVYELPEVDKEIILKVKKKNKAGIKRINKWSGLLAFRNQLLVHNFRIKNESFFSKENIEYKIPNTLSEKNLLSGIIYIICLNIGEAFPMVISSLNSRDRMVDNLNLIGEEIDNEMELELLLNEMKY
ncbi:hypothetical protein [Formosa sp. PL04]|uniref:hypothetical protein n=1 Tax=Formosa sp. PL04 TaxID=3081755 RepID=UPI0029816440|nr:hypothetical protein [Formosa sp. PL04]MDW5288510.1 hypothetical protein [Formosa sp. PL04]